MTRLTNAQKLVAVTVALIMALLTARFLGEHSWNTPEGAEKVDIHEVYALAQNNRLNDVGQLYIRRSSESCSEAQAIASFYDSCVEVFEHDADGDCNSLIAPPEGLTIPRDLTEARRYQSSFIQAAAYTCKSERPRLLLDNRVSSPSAQVGTP